MSLNLTITDLLILAAATWRISFMLTSDIGPWQVFRRMRKRFPIGGLTTCIYCMSTWIGVLMFGLYQTDLRPVVVVCAVMGIALMLGSYTGVNHGD